MQEVNSHEISAAANSLLLGYLLDSFDSQLVGPSFLVFRHSDLGLETRLETSGNSWFEHADGTRKNLFDGFGVCKGKTVTAVRIDGRTLQVQLADLHKLMISGDVEDPDSEGWSLTGFSRLMVGQDVVSGHVRLHHIPPPEPPEP